MHATKTESLKTHLELVPACTIQDIPEELMINVFSYFNAPQASNARPVCRLWNQLLVDNHLWNLFLRRDFERCAEPCQIENSLETYKNCHFVRSKLQNGKYVQRHFNGEGHSSTISSLVYRNGLLYSASYDNTIKIWRLSEMTCSSTLEGHTKGVCGIALNNQFIFSGSQDQTIRIWDITTNDCLEILNGHTDCVSSLLIAGERLYSGSDDLTIKVWDLKTNDCVMSIEKESNEARSLNPLLLSDGKLVTSSDGNITIFEENTGAELHTLDVRFVTKLVCQDGKIVLGTLFGQIMTFDLETGKLLQTFEEKHSSKVSSLLFAENFLFSGSVDGVIKIWDLESGKCLQTISSNNEICHLAYANGQLFVSSDHAITILDFTIR